MRLRWIAGGALAAALAVTAALTGGEGAAAQSAGDRVISVVATGEASARPDIARLNAGVEATAPTARQALDDVNTRLTTVIGAIRAAGIAEDDVQTSGISVYRQEKPLAPSVPVSVSPTGREGQQTEIEFRASNSLNILVRDISQVGPLIDTLIANGVNNLYGVQFSVRDEDALKARALADAVAKARPMAEAAARAAGLNLGEVESIHEGSGFGGVTEDVAFGRGGGSSIASNTPVEPGQLTMRVQVRVTFRLAP